MQLECHRDLTAQRADRGSRNCVNARLLRFASVPVSVLALGKLETASSASQHNSDTTPLIDREHFGVQTRVFESLSCGDERKSCCPRDVLPFFRMENVEWIDAAHFSCDLNRKRRG